MIDILYMTTCLANLYTNIHDICDVIVQKCDQKLITSPEHAEQLKWSGFCIHGICDTIISNILYKNICMYHMCISCIYHVYICMHLHHNHDNIVKDFYWHHELNNLYSLNNLNGHPLHSTEHSIIHAVNNPSIDIYIHQQWWGGHLEQSKAACVIFVLGLRL